MTVRKGILSAMLIAASLSAYADINDTVWSYSKENQAKVPHSYDVEVLGKEEQAYTDILRVVDEINKEKGNSKRYILSNGRMPEITDDVDMVPIFVGEVSNYNGSHYTVAKNKYYTKDKLMKIIKEKDPKEFRNFSYAYMQQNMRYYFGNGNKVKDIIIEKTDKFNNTISQVKKDGNERYLIDGVYEELGSANIFNTLGITSEEFRENFYDGNGKGLGLHNQKVLEFMKKKLKDKRGVDVTIKNGEMWTTDKQGREHRVMWNVNPVSRPEFPEKNIFRFLENSLAKQGITTKISEDQLVVEKEDGSTKVALWTIKPNDASLQDDAQLKKFLDNVAASDDPKVTAVDNHTLRVEDGGKSVDIYIREAEGKVKDISWYKNTLLTQLNVFKELSDRGQILYTGDGSIIIENTMKTDDNDAQMAAGYNQTKPVDDSIEEKVYDTIAKDYAAYKLGEMTKDEFKEKWDFEDDSFETKLETIGEKQIKLDKASKEIAEVANTMGGTDWGSFYYEIFDGWSADTKFPAAYAGTSEEAQNYMKEHNLTLEQFRALLDKTKENRKIKEELEGEIPTLVQNAGIKRIANSQVIVNRYGKRVEFRGRGRIDGTMDFGEGDNRLEITEQGTGRYGTNITFGPYAKLKNISYIAIGGQYTASTGGVGLSGKSSLSIEIDPTKVNEKGRLYQHALKDTWTKDNKIVLKSWEPDPINRDNYAIELKVSSLGKDVEIDLGRPIEVTGEAFASHSSWGDDGIETGQMIKYNTNFYSDSIAHQLTLLDKGNEKTGENGIVGIQIKDSLIRLSDKENEVFRSMAKSGGIGILSDTLSTSNKKTKFSSTVEEDRFEKQKIMNLIEAMVEQETPEEVLKRSSHFKISDDKQPILLANIKEIEGDEDILKAPKQLETLSRFKKVDINPSIEKLQGVVASYVTIIQPDGVSYANKESIAEKINNRFGSTENINAEIERLAKYAEEEFKGLIEKFEDIKPENEDEEATIGGTGYSATKITKSVRDKLAEIKNPPAVSSWDPNPAIRLAKYIQQFRVLKAELEKLQNTTKDDIYEHIVKELEYDAGRQEFAGLDWVNVISNIFYTQRQNESLKELKTVIDQMYQHNIYAKINKISKNEMDSFTTAIQDTDFDFTSGKVKASGGAVSARFSRDKFKGTIYSGYGIYETPLKEDLSLGLVIGGGSSDFHEIVNDDNRTVTTNSKISGTRGYLGSFGRYQVRPNLTWMNGLGLQYSMYDVDRDMKNNYQSETYKGDVNSYAGNIYSNLLYTYKLDDTLDAEVKAGLSYTMVRQGKVKEEDKALSMEIEAQNFNYLDGQFGFGLTKTIYGNAMKSSLGGTLYTIYGISGYDNDNLKGKFKGASSGFDIQGETYQKQSVKLKLDYNVKYDAGLSYGLSGSYLKNSDENNISVGVHAGYTF